MRRFLCMALCLCIFLSGCSLFDGKYVHVTPHKDLNTQNRSQTYSASDFDSLCEVLHKLVTSCTVNAAIYVDTMPESSRQRLLDAAKRYILETDSVGAFALESISLELGYNRGRPAVAAELDYRKSNVEIRQIKETPDLAGAKIEIAAALKAYKPRLALNIADYSQTDFAQMVTDLARENIQNVMEQPYTTEEVFGAGATRLVELIFTYENSRDTLRSMQSQVQPIFNAATLYVSGDSTELQKYSHLYAFLMERFDYTLETSITPSFSLLIHGVGDSRTFALVYDAMCRNAGLDCETVTGTRAGEPWVWNRIQCDGEVGYVDLLACVQGSGFQILSGNEMTGYVWDYTDAAVPPEDVQNQNDNLSKND